MRAHRTSILLVCLSLPLVACGGTPDAPPAAGVEPAAPAPVEPASPDAPAPAPVAAQAPLPVQTCRFSGAPEWFGEPPVLEKACSDTDTPLEACARFSLRFRTDQQVDDQALGIPSQEGELAFLPAGLTAYQEEVGGDVWARIELYLIAQGGGNAAEERWVVFDDAGKQLSPVMDYAQRGQWQAARHEPEQALFWSDPIPMAADCTGQ